MFKIPTPERWIVVVTGPKLIDELRKFPDEQVSFLDAAGEVSFIFGHIVAKNKLTYIAINSQSTRSICSVTLYTRTRTTSQSLRRNLLVVLLRHSRIFEMR